MTKRYYEITGCEPKNYGDVLMLDAVIFNLRERLPEWTPGVRSRRVWQASAFRKELRLIKDEAVLPWRKALLRSAGNIFRTPRPEILPEEIGLVVDTCGYKYGGPWGDRMLVADRQNYARAREAGKQVILMPKTFGPFPAAGEEQVRRLLETVTACYVRDRHSVDNLVAAGLVEGEDFRQFPDFTTNLPGRPLPVRAGSDIRALVIPNIKMVESGKFSSLESYVGHLASLLSLISEIFGRTAILAHHQGRDRDIAARLAGNTGAPVIKAADALTAKGIIGAADFVYSDRFHGLVNAISQAVPALTCGWTYKYRELLADWQAGQLLIDADRPDAQLMREKLTSLAANRATIRDGLIRAGARIRERNAAMWDDIQETLSQPGA